MRFRLAPTPAQEQALLDHCSHARYVWNLAVEQHQHWQLGRKSAPGYAEQSRQRRLSPSVWFGVEVIPR
ncbi:helix-turn-helix domain-containing protein [Actinoallomurus sp. NPDC052274]|uniref:helix-turn-helix domain-containing protein n=1 Tax=Actinoallomurus sp. NPDC052274 TaxID=3155420 RepID=UPI0034292293